MSASSSFDEVAELYEETRLGYAPSILEAIIAKSALPDRGRILEIGAGTGQITVPFAERGYRIVAIEPGAALVKRCARNCQHHDVQMVERRFEEYEGPVSSFDLVLSAQAFHWIERARGIAKAAQLLKPGGAIALAWHFDRSEESEFYQATNPIYDRYFPSAPGVPHYSLVRQSQACIEALSCSRDFAPSTAISHFSRHRYTQDSYLKLLQTHSPILALSQVERTGFLREIGEVIHSHGGTVVRSYETYLVLARRIGERLEHADSV